MECSVHMLFEVVFCSHGENKKKHGAEKSNARAMHVIAPLLEHADITVQPVALVNITKLDSVVRSPAV